MSSLCTQVVEPAQAEGGSGPALTRWFALVVPPRREKVIGAMLRNKGYETVLPVHIRRHQYGRRARSFEIPLFPGYLFCRFDPTVRLPVLTTPGVLHVVGAGRTPIPVADDEVLAIRRAMEACATMTPHEYWQSGRRGRIHSGPLAGVEGIIVNAKPPVRLLLSVSLLQRSVLVEVDAECVTPA
jgi:transcription antitermination factor NusG